jgi:hypothetical protein
MRRPTRGRAFRSQASARVASMFLISNNSSGTRTPGARRAPSISTKTGRTRSNPGWRQHRVRQNHSASKASRPAQIILGKGAFVHYLIAHRRLPLPQRRITGQPDKFSQRHRSEPQRPLPYP